jgi:hypothetical protein
MLIAKEAISFTSVERQVGHDLLQLAILFLELPQPLHLRRQQPAVLLAPIVVGRFADPGFAADLADRCPLLTLPQDEGNLRFRKLSISSWSFPVQRPESTMPLNWNFPAKIGPENRGV